jgi:ribosomal protein S18 acetylase RimI-like enzyme
LSDQFVVRQVEAGDVPFLWDMLWEAAAVDAGMRAIGKEAALASPLNRKYLDGWGRPGDAGVIAMDATGSRLGAAWIRVFPHDAPGYGFVAPDVPEMSIGVSDDARGRGVGTALIDALLRTAREAGLHAISLSVDLANPARALYERMGFRDAGRSSPEETSVTMIVTV